MPGTASHACLTSQGCQRSWGGRPLSWGAGQAPGRAAGCPPGLDEAVVLVGLLSVPPALGVQAAPHTLYIVCRSWSCLLPWFSSFSLVLGVPSFCIRRVF